MKILYCALKHEYGKPQLGPSTIENKHFFGSLSKMEGVEAEYFPFDEIMARVGRDEMNKRLIERVEEWKPDLLFCYLFTEEIKKETIKYITQKTSTKTLNWFSDDNARFPIFTRYWAPLFTSVVTTYSKALPQYKRIGVNPISSQFGVNSEFFKPQDPIRNTGEFHITFVGKNYGKRQWYINYLKKHGLSAEGYGKGWRSGVVDNQKMLEIFTFSPINLNFTESPYITFKDRLKAVAKLFIRKELGKYKINVHNFVPYLNALIQGQNKHIKARTFEVAACGGFMLSGMPDDDVTKYYIPDKEMVFFRTSAEMVAKCKYYLEHEDERKVIAKAGYERTIRDHTYDKRFKEVFQKMGLM